MVRYLTLIGFETGLPLLVTELIFFRSPPPILDADIGS